MVIAGLVAAGVWTFVQRELDFREELETRPLPEGLHPIVGQKAEQLAGLAAERGIRIEITDGFRSHEEQEQLYEQGRTAYGPVVTHARGGQSYHNFGLAIDYAIRTKEGRLVWDTGYDGNGNGNSDWFEVADIAKELGFEWGGDWNGFKDYPHLQMTFGLSTSELDAGWRPEDTDSYEVLAEEIE
ncbi:MAG: M15 family metallopeptidase [Bhargavaea sp.]